MLAASTHAAAYFAVFQPWLPEDLRTSVMSLAYDVPPLCHGLPFARTTLAQSTGQMSTETARNRRLRSSPGEQALSMSSTIDRRRQKARDKTQKISD